MSISYQRRLFLAFLVFVSLITHPSRDVQTGEFYHLMTRLAWAAHTYKLPSHSMRVFHILLPFLPVKRDVGNVLKSLWWWCDAGWTWLNRVYNFLTHPFLACFSLRKVMCQSRNDDDDHDDTPPPTTQLNSNIIFIFSFSWLKVITVSSLPGLLLQNKMSISILVWNNNERISSVRGCHSSPSTSGSFKGWLWDGCWWCHVIHPPSHSYILLHPCIRHSMLLSLSLSLSFLLSLLIFLHPLFYCRNFSLLLSLIPSHDPVPALALQFTLMSCGDNKNNESFLSLSILWWKRPRRMRRLKGRSLSSSLFLFSLFWSSCWYQRNEEQSTKDLVLRKLSR